MSIAEDCPSAIMYPERVAFRRASIRKCDIVPFNAEHPLDPIQCAARMAVGKAIILTAQIAVGTRNTHTSN